MRAADWQGHIRCNMNGGQCQRAVRLVDDLERSFLSSTVPVGCVSFFACVCVCVSVKDRSRARVSRDRKGVRYSTPAWTG